MKKRIEYFDMLRGIAIICVVTSHAFNDYFREIGGVSGLDISDPNVLLRVTFGSLGVALFNTLSGYFLGQKDVSSWKRYGSFLIHQISRVYIPFLLFSLPYFIPDIYHAKTENESRIYYLSFFLGGYSCYYFIILIIQFYILLPILQFLTQKYKENFLIVSFVITALFIFLLSHAVNVQKIDLPLLFTRGPIVFSLCFFVLGVYLGQGNCLSVSKRTIIICSIVTLLINYAETEYIITYYGRSAVSFEKLSWLIYTFPVMVLLFQLKDMYKPNMLTQSIAKMGGYSFGIYLIHFYVFDYITLLSVHWTIKIVLILSGCIVIMYPFKRFTPVFANRVLGF